MTEVKVYKPSVLEVLDEIHFLSNTRLIETDRIELREARDAVAELIKASIPVTRGPACSREEMELFRAALARVNGDL